jgi:hypothetical protein
MIVELDLEMSEKNIPCFSTPDDVFLTFIDFLVGKAFCFAFAPVAAPFWL